MTETSEPSYYGTLITRSATCYSKEQAYTLIDTWAGEGFNRSQPQFRFRDCYTVQVSRIDTNGPRVDPYAPHAAECACISCHARRRLAFVEGRPCVP